MERSDGYPGLAKAYGFSFAISPRIMDLGLLYRALKEKQVDVVAGNSTDGLIAALGMVVLEDDRHYFPPYQAVTIARNAAFQPALRPARSPRRPRRQNLRGRYAPDERRRRRPAARPRRRSPQFPAKPQPLRTADTDSPIASLRCVLIRLDERLQEKPTDG